MTDPVAVVLIDLQAGFFEDGVLHQQRAELVEHGSDLLDWGRRRARLVANVRTEHRRDRSTWTLNMLEDDQGFLLEGDADAQPLPELDLAGSVEVVKTRDDAFLRTGLGELLGRHGIRTVVLAGVSTHSCIAATAAHAYAADLHVVLATDAIASDRAELHEPTLALLEEEYRFALLKTGEITAAGTDLSR